MITTVALGGGVGAGHCPRRRRERAPYDSLNLGGAVGDDPAAVSANRRRAAAALGADPERTVFMRQVHGADVAHATSPTFPARPTRSSRPCPASRSPSSSPTARPCCWPTPSPGSSAPRTPAAPARPPRRPGPGEGDARAGRRARADDRRHRARRVRPLLRGARRDAGRGRRRRARRVRHHRQGHPGLDIRAGVAEQLAAAGVGRVETDPRCTIEDPGLFSYRREGRTGRFAGYVWLKGDG